MMPELTRYAVPYHGDPDELASELNRIHDIVRRMWRDDADARTGYQAGYAHAIHDLARELGVDLDA